MSEANATTRKIYQFPEFDFLANPPRPWVNHLVDFDPNLIVGTVDTSKIPSLAPHKPLYKPRVFQIPQTLFTTISVSENGVPQLPTLHVPEREEVLVPTPESLPAQIGINTAYVEDLLKAAKRSMVGQGHETIHDENIRASSEISAEYITLYPGFMDYIRQIASQMALQLGNPTTVEPRLYKLVLYQEGDHFEDHIDNEHVENMTMTLSVEFPLANTSTDEEKYLADIEAFRQTIGSASVIRSVSGPGGDLVIEDEVVPHPNSKQLGLTLFYHDTNHKVKEVKRGYRMSLIFDVIHNPDQLIPQMVQQYLPSFQSGIQKLRERGVRRIGSPANHIYMLPENFRPDQMPWRLLKGMDRIFWELLRMLNHSSYIETIILDDDDVFYFGALIPIMELTGAFSTTFDYQEEEEGEERDGVPMRQNQPKPITNYGQIIPNLDTSGTFRAVHPKYRMGDIILLKSKGNLRLTYHGNEELHTGNEGFRGEIYSNLGLFADF